MILSSHLLEFTVQFPNICICIVWLKAPALMSPRVSHPRRSAVCWHLGPSPSQPPQAVAHAVVLCPHCGEPSEAFLADSAGASVEHRCPQPCLAPNGALWQTSFVSPRSAYGRLNSRPLQLGVFRGDAVAVVNDAFFVNPLEDLLLSGSKGGDWCQRQQGACQ